LVADLSVPGSVDKIYEAAQQHLGGVDILINNTGGPPALAAMDVETGDWSRYFEAMVTPLFALTQKVLPQMRAQKWGRIITLASTGVVQPLPNLALSNTLRSAIVGWSKTLSNEVASDGITVNMVLPGRIQTDRIDELDAGFAARTGKSVEEVKEAVKVSIPMGRIGRVEEFADTVCFLASTRASYITGSLIKVDGGAVKGI
jgi:3-oxoacyl-[acyl-carrier protein] reductase